MAVVSPWTLREINNNYLQEKAENSDVPISIMQKSDKHIDKYFKFTKKEAQVHWDMHLDEFKEQQVTWAIKKDVVIFNISQFFFQPIKILHQISRRENSKLILLNCGTDSMGVSEHKKIGSNCCQNNTKRG